MSAEPQMPKTDKPAGLLTTLRTVAFGLLGVAGNRREVAEGERRLSPLALVLIGLVFMALFVGTLVTLASHIARG